MSEQFGNDYITIIDDDGNEFELEYLDTMDYNGETYAAFLPTDIDEDSPDFGIIILRVIPDDEGFDTYESIDDDAVLQDVYEHFSVLLFDEDEE